MSSSASIDAGRLLKDLAATWRELGKQQAAHEGPGLLRASSMTLITVAHASDDPQELGATLAEITHAHPCRAIVLHVSEPQPSGTVRLDARATVQCWMPFGRRQQICSEQIDIDASISQLAGVPPILFGLMVADLPVYLWCRDPQLAAHSDLSPICRLADRIIVETTFMPGARAALDAIRPLHDMGIPLTDLAWTRVTRWRALLESIFSTPACRRKLTTIREATITWAGESMPPFVCYFAAWLRTRLAGIQVTLACDDPVTPPREQGRLRRVRLTGDGFNVELCRPGGTIVEVTGSIQGQFLFPLHSEADLLREELTLLGPDPQFEEALREAHQLLA